MTLVLHDKKADEGEKTECQKEKLRMPSGITAGMLGLLLFLVIVPILKIVVSIDGRGIAMVIIFAGANLSAAFFRNWCIVKLFRYRKELQKRL